MTTLLELAKKLHNTLALYNAAGYALGWSTEKVDKLLDESKRVIELAEQPAQQQEPVAIVEAVVPHLESIIVKHILDAPFPKVGDFFYTSPQPSKPWVGLTDEEKADLFEGTAPYYNETDYADAIEAKLREKNA